MYVIDPRAGSINLPKLFPSDMVVVSELKAADICLTNQDITEVWTGIEFKRVQEVLSCIVTGRFAGTQLPMLDATYDDYWLLIEGPFKAGRSGELLVSGNGGHMWYPAKVGTRHFNMSDLDSWIITMTTLTPLKIKITQSRLETRDWVNLLHWWWEKGKDRHQSHMKLDRSRPKMEVRPPTLRRTWAEDLPGIGFDKAIRAEAHFPTSFDMAVADVDEWCKIEGVGKLMAERIIKKIREE